MSEITRTSNYRQALATIKQHNQSLQKAGRFKPEYIRRLNFFLSAVDDQLRAIDDQPTICQMLCKIKGKLDMEHALHDIHKPMGISSFITKGIPLAEHSQLPTVEEIEKRTRTGTWGASKQ